MTTTSARRRAFGATAAAVALLAVSACGGGGAGGADVASAGDDANPVSSAQTEDTEPLDEGEWALAFAECMRDNGVDMPDPEPGQLGLADALQHADVEDEDQETMDRAFAACQDLAPQFGHEDQAAHEQERREMMLELADCIREQGIDDVPDDLGSLVRSGIDLGEEFTAALERCRNQLLGGGP